MKVSNLLLIVIFCLAFTCFGQETEKIYIPKNLEDCFTEINKSIPDSIKVKITNWEESEMSRLHFGQGKWMRNNWGLWEGSRLSRYFNNMGIYHPDDMSGIILTSYHRYLNGKDIKLDEQVKYYKDYWKKAKEENLNRKRDAFSKYKVGDMVVFKYSYNSTSGEQKTDDDNICIARGIITKLNKRKFLIKVEITESCDKQNQSDVNYGNEEKSFADSEIRIARKPGKKIVKHLGKGKSHWFDYEFWTTQN